MELQDNLRHAERMMATLQGSARLAQRGREVTKAAAVQENSVLLKVRMHR
jgi:hypothetical protein